eukprot:2157729-Pyramimonas_sp.AAC.1
MSYPSTNLLSRRGCTCPTRGSSFKRCTRCVSNVFSTCIVQCPSSPVAPRVAWSSSPPEMLRAPSPPDILQDVRCTATGAFPCDRPYESARRSPAPKALLTVVRTLR